MFLHPTRPAPTGTVVADPIPVGPVSVGPVDATPASVELGKSAPSQPPSAAAASSLEESLLSYRRLCDAGGLSQFPFPQQDPLTPFKSGIPPSVSSDGMDAAPIQLVSPSKRQLSPGESLPLQSFRDDTSFDTPKRSRVRAIELFPSFPTADPPRQPVLLTSSSAFPQHASLAAPTATEANGGAACDHC